MTHRDTLLSDTQVIGLVMLLRCLGCSTASSPQPGWSGPLTEPSAYPSMNLGSGYQTDAGNGSVACTVAQSGARPHECGNYDILSCNSPNCHATMIGGGWVYTNPNGPPFVGGATITISNIDGSTVTSWSGVDGFFQIKDPVKPPYKVCVSECPGTNCSLSAHPSPDCQTSNCHGKPGQKIYVSLNAGSTPDAGAVPLDGGSGHCAQPASGGPYAHSEAVFGNQPCSGGGCHCPPNPVFKGAFLYDGPSSTTTVAQATVTLIPSSGTPIKVVSGIDGLVFIGTVTDTATPTIISAPYTACVSKCPLSICSITNGHKTTGDCQASDCHSSDNNMKVFLR